MFQTTAASASRYQPHLESRKLGQDTKVQKTWLSLARQCELQILATMMLMAWQLLALMQAEYSVKGVGGAAAGNRQQQRG